MCPQCDTGVGGRLNVHFYVAQNGQQNVSATLVTDITDVFQDNENLVKFLISSGHLPPPIQVLPHSTSELAITPDNVITVLALQFSL